MDGANISHTPRIALAARLHGTLTPHSIGAHTFVMGAPYAGVRSSLFSSRSRVPPIQNVRQKGLPCRTLRFRNWTIANTSSTVRGIMISMTDAAARHRVHQ